MPRYETLILPVVIVLLLISAWNTKEAFGQEEPAIEYSMIRGDCLAREVGEYLWRRPNEGQAIYAGDRIRLRNGEARIEFPQFTFRMFEYAEVEVPVQLIDGFAEPWQNDLELFVGSYSFEFNENSKLNPIKLVTMYGDISVETDARFSVEITVDGIEINVLSGSISLKHRNVGSHKQVKVNQSHAAQITSSGIFLTKNIHRRENPSAVAIQE